MWSESEIKNFKKIFLDETHCYSGNNKAEKAFDESFGEMKNLDFSELHDEKEVIDKMFEVLEMPPKLAAYFKDNFVNDPALSLEEHFKKGLRLGEENFVLNKCST